MLPIAYYFLQVVLCSALLMGYYWLVLRNKRFHQYNRFYLLAVVLLSWTVPLIKIRWGHPAQSDLTMIRFLNVVAENNTAIESNLTRSGIQWNWNLLAGALYFLMAAFLLTAMFRAFIKIYRLLQTHSCKSVGDVYLILTQAKGTPFSFFRYVFWNDEIDIRSEAGKQILQHELTHVQQKHSYDKIFIQLVLIAGWFNPFFWLIRKEMEMIHEFIADKKAVKNGDTATLAQMLLTAAYPQQQFALTHPFFFSPIKRRLQMLANTKNPRFSYIRRLVVLPLLAIVVVLFSFRNKEEKQITLSLASVMEKAVEKGKQLMIVEDIPLLRPDKCDTVVVQADTVLIQGKDKNDVVKIIPVPTKYPVPDNVMLILDGKKTEKSALELINPNQIATVDVLKDENAVALYGEEGRNGVISIRTKKYATDFSGSAMGKRPGLTGFSMDKTLFIVDGQKTSAEAVKKIEPNAIARVDVLKNETAISQYGDEGKNGVVIITTKAAAEAAEKNRKENKSYPSPGINFQAIARDEKGNLVKNKQITVRPTIIQGSVSGKKLYEEWHLTQTNEEGIFTIVVGQGEKSGEYTDTKITDIDWANGPYFINIKFAKYAPTPNGMFTDRPIDMGTTQMMSVPYALFKSGAVVSDEMMKKPESTELTDKTNRNPKPVFTQTQTPAHFPGGEEAWQKYLQRNLNRDMIVEKGGPPGKYTVVVSFIVDKEGNLSDIHAENDPGYGTKEEAERMIAKGPKWVPAEQNGQKVIYKHKQLITWKITGDELDVRMDGKKEPVKNKKSEREIEFERQIDQAKANNHKTFFYINGVSCVITGSGSRAEMPGKVDIVIVNGKQMTPEELNQNFSRDSFILVAANDTDKIIDKYGKGILLVSAKRLTPKEVNDLMQ